MYHCRTTINSISLHGGTLALVVHGKCGVVRADFPVFIVFIVFPVTLGLVTLFKGISNHLVIPSSYARMFAGNLAPVKKSTREQYSKKSENE